MSTLPMLGNLAWAPVPAIESVEVLDRFNGVPTFGLFRARVAHPQDTDSQRLLGDVLGFLLDALTIALSEDMPPARRELVYTTSEAIRELAAA